MGPARRPQIPNVSDQTAARNLRFSAEDIGRLIKAAGHKKLAVGVTETGVADLLREAWRLACPGVGWAEKRPTASEMRRFYLGIETAAKQVLWALGYEASEVELPTPSPPAGWRDLRWLLPDEYATDETWWADAIPLAEALNLPADGLNPRAIGADTVRLAIAAAPRVIAVLRVVAKAARQRVDAHPLMKNKRGPSEDWMVMRLFDHLVELYRIMFGATPWQTKSGQGRGGPDAQWISEVMRITAGRIGALDGCANDPVRDRILEVCRWPESKLARCLEEALMRRNRPKTRIGRN